MKSAYTCQRCWKNLRSPARSLDPFIRAWPTIGIRNLSTRVQAEARRQNGRLLPAQQKRTLYWEQVQPREDFKRDRRNEVYLPENVELEETDLFHHYSISPSPRIRRRAAFIKSHAYCPHPSHRQTRIVASPHDPEARKESGPSAAPPAHVRFECPDCGIPCYCSEEHWADDYEMHLGLCDTMRQINEDDHDINSLRFFPEFLYPPLQFDEFLPNMSSWDTYLYTREFEAIDKERSLRQATNLLTYPVTIASVIHELSPYGIRNGLTSEGLKSLTALRYSLHRPRDGSGQSVKGIRLKPPSIRLFILGARAESSLPRPVWNQLSYLFPRTTIHIIFIGPEAMMRRESEFPLPDRTGRNPHGGVVEDQLGSLIKITTYTDYYHDMHRTQYFQPYDPYFDCFVLFHPGLGHPASSHEWEETLPQLLETKVPIICTGYTEWDMIRDKEWVEEKMKGEVDLLMHPRENIFRSLKWDLNDLDPADVTCGNWGVWGFRGKRYEAQEKESPLSGVIAL